MFYSSFYSTNWKHFTEINISDNERLLNGKRIQISWKKYTDESFNILKSKSSVCLSRALTKRSDKISLLLFEKQL